MLSLANAYNYNVLMLLICRGSSKLHYTVEYRIVLTVHGIRSGMVGTIQLRAPEAFDFRKPDEWLKWHKRFEQL